MLEELVFPVIFRWLIVVPGGSSPPGMQVELMVPDNGRPLSWAVAGL